MSSVASSSVAESGPVAATPGPVAAVPGPIAATPGPPIATAPGPPLATASAIAPIDVLADEGTYKLGKATKLMVAAASGSFRTLEKVLRQGARVDIVNEIGFTAMHFAAKAKNDNSAVIKELHSQGLSVNSTSKGQKIDGAPPDGYNPLHLVMNAGSATTFIELGADPNAFGSSIVGVGRGPPVFIAAVNGDASELKAMLAGGGFLAGQYCWWATQQGKVSTVKAMHEHGHFDLGNVREQDLSQSSSMIGRPTILMTSKRQPSLKLPTAVRMATSNIARIAPRSSRCLRKLAPQMRSQRRQVQFMARRILVEVLGTGATRARQKDT